MERWSTYRCPVLREKMTSQAEVQVFNPSTQEPEKGRSQGRPSLHSEFQISQDYVVKSCHNKINNVFLKSRKKVNCSICLSASTHNLSPQFTRILV